MDVINQAAVWLRAGAAITPAHQKGSATSRAAARAVEPVARTLRRTLLDYLKEYAATDEELQDAFDMNPSTQRPRRIELVMAGLVVDTGSTRPTRSGRQAVVWAAAGENQ